MQSYNEKRRQMLDVLLVLLPLLLFAKKSYLNLILAIPSHKTKCLLYQDNHQPEYCFLG